jgi:Na+-translocating ferredoxin:NAD+ oxidoreductase RnfG subunit
MRSREWNRILAGLLAAPIPFVAHAETYLTENQAAAVLFPGIRLEPRWMDLTPEEVKAINKTSGQKGLDTHVRIFWGPNKEALVIDRVLGKHDFITYAVAIDAQGKVKGLEIMDYRETYGYQVRGADWRKQFVGKSLHDPIKLGKDIQNISGATLSSKHVTEGVRRVLFTYETLKTKA